jgi:hypothetical protein
VISAGHDPRLGAGRSRLCEGRHVLGGEVLGARMASSRTTVSSRLRYGMISRIPGTGSTWDERGRQIRAASRTPSGIGMKTFSSSSRSSS